jgi:CheY-like chemotaxis protein
MLTSGDVAVTRAIYLVAGIESIRYSSTDFVLSFADTLTTITSYLLATLATVEVAQGWWRDRDEYRADLLLTVGVLIAILLGQGQVYALAPAATLDGAAFTLLFLSQPVLLLRLVARFHPVAHWQWLATIGGVVAGCVVSLVVPTAWIDAWHLIMCGYFALVMAGIARAFETESARASGAGAMRLRCAATGSWLHAGIAVAFALAIVLPDAAPIAALARKTLSVGMLAFYYVGLIGPRMLTSLWTHRELYRFLRVTSERSPDERVREAPADLARAAAQSVTCAAATVLLFDDEAPQTLVSYTPGASPLRGVSVPFGHGLITDAIRRGVAITGATVDCEPEFAAAANAIGASVTVVPIASSEHTWGALVVVRRTGSLFLDLDESTLTELCRHAAASLWNARLITMELDRLRRDAAVLRLERQANTRADASTPVRVATPSADGRLRVLAVEDEEGVRDFLRALLAREGYHVTLASGHDEALAFAAETPFDLVVTDVNMPDGSGPDLVKALRRRQPYLPAVFISGISRDEFAEMAPGEERNFLQKPFEGARLVGRIEALLQR